MLGHRRRDVGAARRPADERRGLRLGAVAAGVLLAASAPASAAADGALLRAHAPVYRLDSREGSPPVTVTGRGRFSRRPGPVYGRVVTRGERTWLQYWTFYPENPQDRGVLRTGRHQGDWELVQLGLAGGRPRSATYAQHAWATTCPWSGERPVVYVAHASHAAYFEAGRHERPWPDPNDETDGGRRLLPRVVEVSERSPSWMAWPERWGRSGGGWVPGEHPSPRGPAFQGTRWSDPEAFERSGRDCGAPSPWQWTETWLTPGLLALGFLAAGLGLRRRLIG